jgi:ankyrin repeat protein
LASFFEKKFPFASRSQHGDLDAVRREINVTGVNVFIGARSGLTPLIVACIYERVEIARFLLQRGASACAITSGLRDTAIYGAAQVGRVDLIDLLLAHGADVNVCNAEGTTPLQIAAQRNHRDAARRLLAVGARVTARDSHQRTALHLAARAGADDIVRCLTEANASIDDRTENGETLLMCAAYSKASFISRTYLAPYPCSKRLSDRLRT